MIVQVFAVQPGEGGPLEDWLNLERCAPPDGGLPVSLNGAFANLRGGYYPRRLFQKLADCPGRRPPAAPPRKPLPRAPPSLSRVLENSPRASSLILRLKYFRRGMASCTARLAARRERQVDVDPRRAPSGSNISSREAGAGHRVLGGLGSCHPDPPLIALMTETDARPDPPGHVMDGAVALLSALALRPGGAANDARCEGDLVASASPDETRPLPKQGT